MAKHTPGPWTIGVSSPDIPEALCIRDPSGWGVAHVFGIGENAVRDARLIAAAPDLLAALKALYAAATHAERVPALKLSESAIAKAEGNPPADDFQACDCPEGAEAHEANWIAEAIAKAEAEGNPS